MTSMSEWSHRVDQAVTTPAQNEAMILRYIDEVFNGHQLARLETYLAADLVSRWLGDETLHGLPAWKAGMVGFFAAFPDATYTLDDLFFAADKGVWRGTWRATQRGAWEGVTPSGRVATWTAVIIGRFAGGKIVEDWYSADEIK